MHEKHKQDLQDLNLVCILTENDTTESARKAAPTLSSKPRSHRLGLKRKCCVVASANKKLRYCRVAARRVMSVEILSTAAELYEGLHLKGLQ